MKSDDEFAELALDLNHFLDRIALLVRDLDKILGEVLAVGTRLGSVTRGLEHQFDRLRDAALGRAAEDAQRGLQAQVAASREGGALEVMFGTLDDAAEADPRSAAGEALQARLGELRQHFAAVQQALLSLVPPPTAPQSAEYQTLAQSLREMAVLEATMQSVAESGRQVLGQLEQGRAPT